MKKNLFICMIICLSFISCSDGWNETYDLNSVVTPVAPDAPVVTAGDGFLAVSWTAIKDVAAYEIWYNNVDDYTSAIQPADGVDIVATNYNITQLTNGITYYIWLKAKNSAGISGFGAVAYGSPRLPAPGTAAIVSGDQQLTISWSPVVGATAYEVWYSTLNNTTSPTPILKDSNITTTSYIITGLVNETTYYIWLKSKNSITTSDFNISANGTPGSLPTLTTTVILGNLSLTPFIAGTSAKGGGIVISAGSSNVTDRGLCWNTTGNPTVNNSKVSDGTGIGAFSNSTMKVLLENTVYYVRAFATNRAGTAYGTEVSFNSGKIFGTDYAGGYVFYNDGNTHGLVSSKTDQSNGVQWNNGSAFPVTGASALFIGSGQANTNAIIAAQGDTGSYAAKICNDLVTIDGYNDWFLPSKDELNLMYIRLKFTGFGGFAVKYYWSSSEDSDYNAWWQFFNDGYQNYDYHYKGSLLYVRAIRAF